MKKNNILFVFVLISIWCHSQNDVISYLEYKPAPGQYINIENTGTPEAAQKMTEEFSSLVSLGGFGGYIVLEFENACVNDPENPYGIDFTVFGNAFSGSSEPGIIWIMKDENHNGRDDDIWYEIAGSKYFHSRTVKNYKVTYFKTGSGDIFWKDNMNDTGWIRISSYHTQEYYPVADYFPQYPRDSVKFTGTKLRAEIDSSDIYQIKTCPPAFGYADSHSWKQGVDLTLPDNPYTLEVEGAGGDPVDISWAVDSLGNYVDIDSIHFVKIVTGNMASIGWLGEISTDVAWIEDVDPRPEITGKEEMLVVYPYQKRILTGDTMQIEASYFKKGRIQDTSVSFHSDDDQVLSVDASGIITAGGTGEAEIFVSAGEEASSAIIKVVAPDSIAILADLSAVYPGDSVLMKAEVFDNEGLKVDVPVQFSSSNTAVGKVVQNDGIFNFVALQPGETVLKCIAEGFSIEEEVFVKVFSPHEKISIYFSVKTEEQNLLPFQWIEISVANLNQLVEKRQSDYSGLDRPVLFHALAAGLTKAGVNFSFRDDENADGKLYLYSVEKEGFFTYGWGGKTSPAQYAKAWIARLNSGQFLNCFDEIEISDGDTVDLYHISDITGAWIYSRLLANKDTAGPGEDVILMLEQTECIYSGLEITETEFTSLINTEIKVSGGQSYFTDENGIVLLTVESEPPVVCSSGNDAVSIFGRLTSVPVKANLAAFSVYPNPVYDELTVKCFSGFECRLHMYDSNGRIIYESNLADTLHYFDVSTLSPGVYYLVVLYEGRSETRKLIKQ